MTNEICDRLTAHKKRCSGGLSKICVALILGSALLACTPQETDPNADNNVTSEEVAKQTSKVAGQTVTIRSKVQQKVSDSSFMLNNEGENILVVNVSSQPFVLPAEEDYEIQATGEVVPFVRADLERTYSLTLDPKLYAEFETKPAILAKSLALAPDPGEITQRPERFYNLPIAVEGEVEKIVDPTTFTLDEDQLFGANDLLVIGAPVTESLSGQAVTVTGKMRRFVLTEFETDYDLTWDLNLKKQIEAEYSEKPVLVADGLYPTAQEK